MALIYKPEDILAATEAAVNDSSYFVDPVLKGFHCIDPKIDGLEWDVQYGKGTFCYSFAIIKDKQLKCLRVWKEDSKRLMFIDHIKRVSECFNQYNIEYVIGYSYIERAIRLKNGIVLPAVLMDWVNGDTLIDYIRANYRNLSAIHRLANEFLSMCQYHQRYSMAHGDLSDGNIIVRSDGKICLIDYDSFYYHGFGSSISTYTKGTEGYQHPDRLKKTGQQVVDYRTDYFSQLVIYLSLLAIADNPKLFNPDGDYILFQRSEMANVSSFTGCSTYKKVAQSSNPEVRRLLSELRTALGGRLEDVRSIVDYLQPATRQIDLEKQYWEGHKGTVDGCREYLRRYPSGRFSNEARGIVTNYEKAERARAAIQADDRFWGSNRDTIEGCRKYLSQYPSGRHTFEAKNTISELSKKRLYSILGWSAGIVLFVLFNVWLFSLGKPSATPEEMAQVLKELREQFDSTNGKSTVELCAESQSMDCLEYIDGLIEKAEKMDGGNSDVKYYRNKYDEIKGGALRSIIKELDELFDNSKSTSTVKLCVQSRSIDGLQYVNHLIARGESLDKKNKQIKSYRKQFDKLTKGIKI